MNATDYANGWSALTRLIDYHLPPLSADGPTLAPLIGLTIAGLLLVFFSVTMVRWLLALGGAAIGAAAGYVAAEPLGTSVPLTMALAGALVAVIASSLYRFWLTAASVVIVFAGVAALQLGVDGVMNIVAPSEAAASEIPRLPSTAELDQPLAKRAAEYARATWERARTQFTRQGSRGMILPAAAAVLTIILGWRATRLISGLWVSAGGAVLAVAAGAALACAWQPEWRSELTARPRELLGAAAALWAMGILMQARRALRQRNSAAVAAANRASDSAK